jgi:tetratricopeptide (TPR) repeat protein
MEREFQAAMAAEDSGDLDRAESLLLGLRAKHPGIFAVDESLGLVYIARKNIAQALPLLEAAAREEPVSDAAHANLGAAYFRLHRNREALTEFQLAARLNPKNAETQQALGRLWMEVHKPARAAEAFAAALQLRPGNSDLLLARAQALEEAGKTSQAKNLVSSVPGVDQSAAAQSLLGDIEEKSGAYGEAARHYARAAELDPHEDNAWVLGVEFLRHWTFDAAIREFEAAATKFPQSKRIRLGLGVAYFGNGNYAKSVPVFADLLDADAGNALYAELLGMACTKLTQEDKPRCSALTTYAESHPGDAKASTYTATMLIHEGVTDEQINHARKLLESAIAADPKLAEARYQMGMLQQIQGDWAGSVPNLQAAVALRPNFVNAHYRLGLAYSHTGDKQTAQSELALYKKYYALHEDALDRRLHQITTLLVDMH